MYTTLKNWKLPETAKQRCDMLRPTDDAIVDCLVCGDTFWKIRSNTEDSCTSNASNWQMIFVIFVAFLQKFGCILIMLCNEILFCCRVLTTLPRRTEENIRLDRLSYRPEVQITRFKISTYLHFWGSIIKCDLRQTIGYSYILLSLQELISPARNFIRVTFLNYIWAKTFFM